MNTVLVTGATGFLGMNLVSNFLKKKYRVVGTGHSEKNIKECEMIFGDKIKLYSIDIGNQYASMKNIIRSNNIDYIVHAAALKHVGVCEKNPSRAVQVNVVGTQNIVSSAVECDVKNIIGISTDKAIAPMCVYGMTKKLMEEIILEHNYGIFQGVNFFFSTGSVLDIWDKLRKQNKIIKADPNAVRYFCTIDDVSKTIINNIDCREKFSIPHCYEISITDLQKAYCTYHDFWMVDKYIPLSIEKKKEVLPLENIKVLKPSIPDIVKLIEQHYRTENSL